MDFAVLLALVLFVFALLLSVASGQLLHQRHRLPPTFDDFDLSNATRYPQLSGVGPNDPPTIEEVSSKSPRVFLIHNALTAEECDHLRNLAAPLLRQSYVGTAGQGMKPSTDRRTSQSTFLLKGSIFESRQMRSMRKRIANVTGFDPKKFADL